MSTQTPYRIRSIIEYHRILGLPNPHHPLISVIDIRDLKPQPLEEPISIVFDFYTIAIKRNVRIKYGQQSCDFDEGIMFFTSPGQVIGVGIQQDSGANATGWMILFHPDLLWNTSLAATIKKYQYFTYSVSEALFLSEMEEETMTQISKYIEQEYRTNLDRLSRSVIVVQLELLMKYGERFYQRQFLTREKPNHNIITQMETLLCEWFDSRDLSREGLPTVAFLAERLHLSAGYLSELLKAVTGRTAQQHIHDRLIEKAKERLSTTQLTVSEIAYELGFEHLQSFSRLFKAKTSLSPMAFRQSFN